MRTSGAATETNMIVVMFVIATGVLMVLAGGPAEFLLTLEHLLWAAFEAIYQIWISLVG
jgi:hypothetical protein